MRPFGCPVTILNTLDHLGKFDEKADEGFFVGYSTNSKAFRVFNSRTRIVEENLHVKFNENTPNMDVGKARMEKVPKKEYILLPLWTADPQVSSQPKKFPDGELKPAEDGEKKDDDGKNDRDEEKIVNSINTLNAANTKEVNVNGANSGMELPNDPNIPDMEEIIYSEDEDDVGVEADITNLNSNIHVSPIPTTRIHKDHPLDQVIGDVHSVTQTRRMSKKIDEHGLVAKIHEGIKHKDFQNCLFACFLSQIEPKKEEGIDYDEVFAPVARIEAIRFFLAYASYMDFIVYQMDVKSAFQYGTIEEEVYVCQPPGFEDL
ncbi:ribonuclease H-like domain-containing protein [Tanacetum coccineum]